MDSVRAVGGRVRTAVGDAVDSSVGVWLGADVGRSVGDAVGKAVRGAAVGVACVGPRVGPSVAEVGTAVGDGVGARDGDREGVVDVGATVAVVLDPGHTVSNTDEVQHENPLLALTKNVCGSWTDELHEFGSTCPPVKPLIVSVTPVAGRAININALVKSRLRPPERGCFVS